MFNQLSFRKLSSKNYTYFCTKKRAFFVFFVLVEKERANTVYVFDEPAKEFHSFFSCFFKHFFSIFRAKLSFFTQELRSFASLETCLQTKQLILRMPSGAAVILRITVFLRSGEKPVPILAQFLFFKQKVFSFFSRVLRYFALLIPHSPF